jgi:hypothetical protein
VVSDFGGFADDNTCSMIDEEVMADCRARVDVDTGDAVAYSVIILGISGTFSKKSSWAIL